MMQEYIEQSKAGRRRSAVVAALSRKYGCTASAVYYVIAKAGAVSAGARDKAAQPDASIRLVKLDKLAELGIPLGYSTVAARILAEAKFMTYDDAVVKSCADAKEAQRVAAALIEALRSEGKDREHTVKRFGKTVIMLKGVR
jgi:hypothetical protein